MTNHPIPMTPTFLHREITSKVKERLDLGDKLVFLGYRGSISHGLATDIGDLDILGIIVPSLGTLYGMRNEWGSSGCKDFKFIAGDNKTIVDVVLYDIRKWFRLLCSGNPSALEALFLDESFLISGVMPEEITGSKSVFVVRSCFNAFAGYANDQIRKMTMRPKEEVLEYLTLTSIAKQRGIHPNDNEAEDGTVYQDDVTLTNEEVLARLKKFQAKGENIGKLGDKRKKLLLEYGYDCKNAAHCIRLLKMGIELMTFGEMNVLRKADRDELLDIKRGKCTLDDVKAYAGKLFVELREARDTSSLAQKLDEEQLVKIDSVLEKVVDGIHNETIDWCCTCSECGTKLSGRYDLNCSECRVKLELIRKQEQAVRDQDALEKAIIVPDYNGPYVDPADNDYFYPTLDEYFMHADNPSLEGFCYRHEAPILTLEDVLYGTVADEQHDDWEPKGEADLANAIEMWNFANRDNGTWYVDNTKKWSRKRKVIKLTPAD